MTQGHFFGGAMLVAGTCIGAAALALPLDTAAAGFIPSVFTCLIIWLFMCATGLLLLETTLWMGEGANIVSMASRLLGPAGKAFAWVLYLYLFYSLTVAYVAGGGDVISELTPIPRSWATLLFVALFGGMVYLGTHAVDRMNLWLVLGLAASYAAFVAVGLPNVQSDLLLRQSWISAIPALPIVITSFGFQGLVPSLTGYMRRHPRRIALAIIVGSALPLLAYILWELIILGSVPPEQLTGATNAVAPLRGAPWIFALGQFFAFFALTSSFLGVTLGLRDFLADGLKVRKDRQGRATICAIIFLPALGIALFNPNLFISALRYGGGTGCTLLLGLLPILMVWSGRYRKELTGNFRLPGGRPLLILMTLFVLLVLAAELLA
jgi:tyrosine-specific transport protein